MIVRDYESGLVGIGLDEGYGIIIRVTCRDQRHYIYVHIIRHTYHFVQIFQLKERRRRSSRCNNQV